MIESTFRSPMPERDLVFHATAVPHLAAYASANITRMMP